MTERDVRPRGEDWEKAARLVLDRLMRHAPKNEKRADMISFAVDAVCDVPAEARRIAEERNADHQE